MNINEKVHKFIDDQRLKREVNLAKKKISKVNNKLNQEEVKEKEEESTKVFKFNFERLKDVGLIAVAVMLIGAGYVNFSSNDISKENTVVETASEYSNNLGDVQLVSSEADLVENEGEEDDDDYENEDSENIVEDEEVSKNSDELEDSVLTSTSTSEYFTELKLNRDNMYSQKLETYQQIVDSASISSEQKAIAIQEIEEITNTQNSIQVAEELIKLKGFENVVIYVNDDSVSVIIRAAALMAEQVAQIQNIVSRELNVEVRKY